MLCPAFVDERVNVIPGVYIDAATERKVLLSCVNGIAPGHHPRQGGPLSRERWSTKRGKPGQLAPRVHLRLIQCIIPTPPPPRSPDKPAVWLTEKRSSS